MWGRNNEKKRGGGGVDARREPGFKDPKSEGLHVDPEDRIGGGRGRKRKSAPLDDFDDAPAPRRGRASARVEPFEEDRAPITRRSAHRAPVDDYVEDDYEESPRPRARPSSRRTRGGNGGSSGGSGGRYDDGGGRRKRRSLLGRLFYWSVVLCVWGIVSIIGVVIYYGSQLPPIDQLAIPKRPPNIAIMAMDGALLANRGDTGGPAISLGELPPYLPNAFVAIEDRRFYAHWGVDPIGVIRAMGRDVSGKGGMQGGSTLTQQLAKNLFLTQERTMSRKIQEAILAVWLEHKYSKKQLLELYLNRVYFGAGSYGVEAAAQKYFGHSARNVTLPEAAMLAGLMKAPTKLAPNRNIEGARERAAQVVAAMARENMISPKEEKATLDHPAAAVRDPLNSSINYAADYVMDMLDDTIGAIDEDIVVSTTISGPMQMAGEKALGDELDKKGIKYGVSQGALTALAPDGGVRAMVGGRNYADSQFNRVVAAKRQPGSSFKPFVYLAAMERGLTPDTVREDAPINVKGWQPTNYSHEYYGPITLTNALAYSLNTVAVRLGLEVGPKTVVKTAHRLGIVSELQPNASISLGTSEVSPLEIVSAYAAFANGGIGVQPYIISKVTAAKGKLLYQRRQTANNGRVIDPQILPMMTTMMQETLLTGTARKADLAGWQAAGKTGTSQDFRDAWFVGYTSQLVTGVWLGNDDNSPTKKVSGGNLPVEVWSRFMREALRGVPPSPIPGGIWRGGGPVAEPSDEPTAESEPAAALPGRPNAPTSSLSPPAPGAPPAPATSVAARRPLRDPNAPEPPEDIPDYTPPAHIPPQEKNIFERLFGG